MMEIKLMAMGALHNVKLNLISFAPRMLLMEEMNRIVHGKNTK